MIPRWVIGLIVLGIIIWFFSDPAGMANTIDEGVSDIGTFFSNLGD